MRLLDLEEVKAILSLKQMLTDDELTAILDEVEKEQPEIYRMMYGEFSDSLAEINQDVSNLFLELCFDVIWIFRQAFGKPPQLKKDENWVLDSLTLLDMELKSLDEARPMHKIFREKLQKRFVERSFETVVQTEVLTYLNAEVEKYASFKPARKRAVHATQNLLFVFVRLMGDLYHSKS